MSMLSVRAELIAAREAAGRNAVCVRRCCPSCGEHRYFIGLAREIPRQGSWVCEWCLEQDELGRPHDRGVTYRLLPLSSRTKNKAPIIVDSEVDEDDNASLHS